MTEKEAIKVLVSQKQCIDKSSSGQCKINCGYCKKNIPIAYLEKSYEVAIAAIEEIQQYREIGTAEECREAVEKQKPKKPRDIEYDYSYFICPNCGEGIYVSDNFESHKFCLNCGQAIRCPDENLEGMEDV